MPCAPTQDLRISGHCWRTSFKMLPSPVEILFCFVVTYGLSQELAVFVVSHCLALRTPGLLLLDTVPFLFTGTENSWVHGVTPPEKHIYNLYNHNLSLSFSIYLHIYIIYTHIVWARVRLLHSRAWSVNLYRWMGKLDVKRHPWNWLCHFYRPACACWRSFTFYTLVPPLKCMGEL